MSATLVLPRGGFRACCTPTRSGAKSDPDSTPVLEDITINWLFFIHTEDVSGGLICSYALYGAVSNPAFGFAAISFALPLETRTYLTVYDLSGRVVGNSDESYRAGAHQICLNNLASGVYIVRLRAGDFDDTKRFVLLR
ncbi:MAG: T9SS type A sorting domain-containing protein [Candidatus Aegiribacteria sp.]|nr:T9SS type A sorting domain-containing protein [Candidatus Aegiribacteria sp.]MBD3295324.1 T9SS type A sorting domain-containing protein [Candidatus Fermentibacteria bacterium]